MKKLTVFLTLLLCVCFTKMSASQTHTVRWSLSGYTMMKIFLNGTLVSTANSTDSSQNGSIVVTEDDVVQIEAYTAPNYENRPLTVMTCEDDPFFYEAAMTESHNFYNSEHTLLYEQYSQIGVDWYIEISN